MGNESAERERLKTVRENLIEGISLKGMSYTSGIKSATGEPDDGNWKLTELGLIFLVFSEK